MTMEGEGTASWLQSAYVALVGERRGAYRIMVERSKGRSPLGRTKSRWEDNVNTDI
jgi:hypothetical protein